jgi:hypothetical protein
MIWSTYIYEPGKMFIRTTIYVPYHFIRKQIHWVYNRPLLFTNVCFTTGSMADDYNMTMFDSNSVPINIDNCCLKSISCSINDFESESLRKTEASQVIKGFGNTKTLRTHMGTLHWKVLDDNGVEQTIRIPNSLFVPGGGVRLLSPQHWAQQTPNDKSNGMWI